MTTINAVNNGLSGSTGTGSFVGSTSPTLISPALGTPTAIVLSNGTNLPISSGVSGLGTGVATFLATPSSANLASAITDETGSGALVFANSPSLTSPALGTPSSAVLTNATNLPVSSGISGLASGIATFLATPTSANLATAVTNETGSGSLVFATSPTLVTPVLGAASATSITFTSTTGVVGTTTNDNAAAGSVGELIESNILSGSAITLTSGVTANITSISLIAGDYDVWGTVEVVPSGTLTVLKCAVSTSSAALPVDAGLGSSFCLSASFTSGNQAIVPCGMRRVSVSSTTTVYLVVAATFGTGCTGFGYIGARRRR